jgi:periplasmic divalent cation tolerance protein
MKDCVTILTTVANAAEANSLAKALVERKLAACVQSFPVTSCYVWDGKINNDAEILLFIKTRSELYGEAETAIRELHAYATPEIICLPILSGSKPYLDWIFDVTAPAAKG